MKDEFYIGYLPKAPKRITRFVKSVIGLLFLGLVLTAFILASNQKNISNGIYEYGNLTLLEGVLYKKPQPFLKVLEGTDVEGKPVFKNILLVNYGKFGALASLKKMEEKTGKDLTKVKVKIRGTLIYHNGVTLLELTEKEEALQGFEALDETEPYSRTTKNLGNLLLTGEIIDPKCYFGSMKPGQGKPHRSCAILCISGGIPPMYVVKTKNDQADYYLLMGENGNPVNKEVLNYVADPTLIEGRAEQIDEWKVIYINPSMIQRVE